MSLVQNIVGIKQTRHNPVVVRLLLWYRFYVCCCSTCRLLDILAGRKRKSGLSGIVLVNGDRQPKNFKCISGYVVQVRETLMCVCVWEQCVWVGAVCVGGSNVCGWEQCVWVGAVCVGGSSVCGWVQCVWVGAAYVGGSSVCGWEQCVWVGAVCVGRCSVCGWEQCVWVGAVCVGGGRCRGSPLVTAHGGGRYMS